MIRLAAAALSALALAGLSAPAAHAATPFTVGTGAKPHIAVSPNGTAHVVWFIEERGTTPGKVGYCRVPAGASACNRTAELPFPDRPAATERPGGGLVVQATDTKVDVVASCNECEASGIVEKIERWTSLDGGTSFAAPVSLGGTPTTSGLAPDGVLLSNGVFVSPADGDGVIARPGPADNVRIDPVSGFLFVYSPSVVAVPATNKLVFAVNDLGVVKYAVYQGANQLATTIMTQGNWLSDRTLSAPEGDSGETRLNAGPSGVWLTYGVTVPGDDRAVIRRFDPATNTFDAPRTLDATAGPDASVQYPSSNQDAGGRIHVVWRNLFDTKRLRYVRSDASGATFTAPANIAQGEDFIDPEVAAGADGNGYAVWQGIGGTPIRVVRIEPYAEAGETPPAPGPTTTPPTSTPRPTATVPAGRRVRTSVPGATIDFGLPKGCVQPGQTFRVTLKWKRKKRKGNVFVKVFRTDFYIGTRRVKIDRKAPFIQTLRVTASARRGSKITVRARAFMKVKRGRPPKKSIRATITVCP